MIAWHGSPVLFDRFDPAKLGVRRMGSEGHGLYLADRYDVAAGYGEHCYEVEIPDGPYIDNDQLCSEQPEPAKAIFRDVSFTGPMAGYWRFVIDEAPNQDVYSQVGKLLVFCRKQGAPLEPALITAGFKGCKRLNPTWREFVVFDPDQARILSVAGRAN